MPRDEVERCEWSLKEAIDNWASAIFNYNSAQAERIKIQQYRGPWKRDEDALRRMREQENAAMDSKVFWASVGETRVKLLDEALARNPVRKAEFDWRAYQKKLLDDPSMVAAVSAAEEQRMKARAEAARADQVMLGLKIQEQQREVDYLGEQAEQQRKEVDNLQRRYFDLRAEAERAAGAEGVWRQDVQDAKAALDAAELELSTREINLQQARQVLDDQKAKRK